MPVAAQLGDVLWMWAWLGARFTPSPRIFNYFALQNKTGSYSVMTGILVLIKTPLHQCLIVLYLLANEMLQFKGSRVQALFCVIILCLKLLHVFVFVVFQFHVHWDGIFCFSPTATCLAGAISICYPSIWRWIISQQYCFPLSNCMSSVSCRNLPSLQS